MDQIPLVGVASAIEAFAITIVFPQYLPQNPFVWTLIRAASLNYFLLTAYHCLVWPFLLSPLRHLPQPGGSKPIIGNGLALFKKPPAVDFLRWVTEIPNDGLIYFRGFFYQERLLLTDPKTISEVLVHKSYDFEKPGKLRDFLRLVLGDGLIIVEGEQHKFQRKHIMPAFQFRHIKEMYPMMWKKAVAFTQVLNQHVHENAEAGETLQGVVEINHFANQVTMDIIGVAGLGREFRTLYNSDDPIIQNYEELLEPTLEKSVFFTSQILGPAKFIRKLPIHVVRRFKATTSVLNDVCIKLVQEKKEALRGGKSEGLDILSILIRANCFSDGELRDQMLTFLAAGHETTSSALTWASYLLATHTDVQTQLRQELREHVPTNPEGTEDLATLLESLPMLNAVCNETLRLFPTVPITVRMACRDTHIGEVFVPKGTQVLLSPWAINRSPHLWGENASDFKPERWVSQDGKPNNHGGAQSNYALLTFLHGPRSCIGGNFAKAELRCLVAALVDAFEIEYAHPGKPAIPAGVITTKPKDGMELRLTPLKAW